MVIIIVNFAIYLIYHPHYLLYLRPLPFQHQLSWTGCYRTTIWNTPCLRRDLWTFLDSHQWVQSEAIRRTFYLGFWLLLGPRNLSQSSLLIQCVVICFLQNVLSSFEPSLKHYNLHLHYLKWCRTCQHTSKQVYQLCTFSCLKINDCLKLRFSSCCW